MISVILASNNANKLREFKSLFDSKEVQILSLSDIGYQEDIIEDGQTFADNALIKARTIAEKYHQIVISDDSGLEVYSLNNAPGIYSARYAGPEHDDLRNNALLVHNLANVDDRRARYVCAICICQPNLEYRIVEGICEGEIILTPRGVNGFGYDPYFYLPRIKKTFAEISLKEKNEYSHRARAIAKIKDVCNEDFSFI